MAEEGNSSNNNSAVVTLYNSNAITSDSKSSKSNKSSFSIKISLAQTLRGGVIVLASTPDQAKIAESAGACCLLISEPPPRSGGIGRMPDPSLIKQIKQSVSIPVMARSRVGHFVEAMILETLDVDYIDESEELGIADESNFINKHNFRLPFICGCADLGAAFRRVREGAAMVRIQGNARHGDVSKTVANVRSVLGDVRKLANMAEDEVFAFAKRINAPYDIVAQTKQMGRLPVVQFASGGIVTPADAAMMMQLGCDGVFVGAEVFESGGDPYRRVRSIVQAVRHYSDPQMLVECYYYHEDAEDDDDDNDDDEESGLADGMAGVDLRESEVGQIENEGGRY